jgi:predicted NUDIX family NTP pyrophosphohydrolase
MPKISAGLLMYRRREGQIEVLLVHPGGPFFTHKDHGAWSIPKGELDQGEDLLPAARREFREETGVEPVGPFIPLTPIRQKSGKIVHAWAFEGDCDPAACRSNTFEMCWPPGSEQRCTFPEVDKAGFFTLDEAARKIKPAQQPLLDELLAKLR